MHYDTTKEEQFDAIYRAYHNDVYKISLYYTKNEAAAQDIAQNVFYQFYLHCDNINPERIRPYLVRSARNYSYNWLRDMKREVQSEFLENVPEDKVIKEGVEERYMWIEQRRENRKLVNKIMEGLRQENESWYDIINLIYCLEKSHDDVCDELDITKDVLYSKLYRAKRWLRKTYEKEYHKFNMKE